MTLKCLMADRSDWIEEEPLTSIPITFDDQDEEEWEDDDDWDDEDDEKELEGEDSEEEEWDDWEDGNDEVSGRRRSWPG